MDINPQMPPSRKPGPRKDQQAPPPPSPPPNTSLVAVEELKKQAARSIEMDAPANAIRAVSYEEPSEQQSQRMLDERNAWSELRLMIDDTHVADLKGAIGTKNQEWKGGVRALAAQVYFYSRYVPPKIRSWLFSLVYPDNLVSTASDKKDIESYFMNQFHSMFTEYQKQLDRLVIQFLGTPAGLYLQELVQAELERRKGVPFTSMEDFHGGFSKPSHMLGFKGKMGLEFTAYHICDVHRRPLPFIQQDPPLGDSSLNNWIAGPYKKFWLSHLSSSTLRDAVSLVLVKVLSLGDVKEVTAKTKESRFGDCSWRNRGLLGRSVKLPMIDDWPNRARFFAANYNYPPDPSTALFGNDIHNYLIDPTKAASNLVVEKSSPTCNGDGSSTNPFTAINKQLVGPATPSVYPENQAAPADSPPTVEHYYDDDTFIEENPNVVETITKAQEDANRERCRTIVLDLENARVPHNFKNPENFEHMVKFFNIINTPPAEEHSRMSRAFAMLSFRGQAQLFKANANNIMFILARIGSQLEDDQRQVRAAIEEVDESVAVIQRTLEFMSRIKSNRIALDDELKAKQATHDRLDAFQKSTSTNKFDIKSTIGSSFQQPVTIDDEYTGITRHKPTFSMAPPPPIMTPATSRYDHLQPPTPTTPCPPTGRGRSAFVFRDASKTPADRGNPRSFVENGRHSLSRDVSAAPYQPVPVDDGYTRKGRARSHSRSRSRSRIRGYRDSRRHDKYEYDDEDSYESYDSSDRYDRRHGTRHHRDRSRSRRRHGHRDRRVRDRGSRRSRSPHHQHNRKRKNASDVHDEDQGFTKRAKKMTDPQARPEDQKDVECDEYGGSESTDEMFDRLEKEGFASTIAAGQQVKGGDGHDQDDDDVVIVDGDNNSGHKHTTVGDMISPTTPNVPSPITEMTTSTTIVIPAPNKQPSPPSNITPPISTGAVIPTGSTSPQKKVPTGTDPAVVIKSKPSFVAPDGFMGIDKTPR